MTMRSFSGTRNSSSGKRNSASEALRKQLMAKYGYKNMSPAEEFKERMDAKVAEYMDRHQKAQNRRGDGAKEVTKQVKEMIMNMAQKEVMRDIKKQKKIEVERQRQIKKEKAEVARVNQQWQDEQDRKNKEWVESQQNAAKSYFFGSTDDNNT